MTRIEKIKSLMNNPIKNICHSFYDDYVEANARFRSKAGVRGLIIRQELAKCCDWCKSLAGIYYYDERPDNIFARHDACKCMVTVKFQKRGYEDAWSKREYRRYKIARQARIEQLIAENLVGGYNNTTAKNYNLILTHTKTKIPERFRWRVDVHKPKDYKGCKLHTTPGGSTCAITKDGDIISLATFDEETTVKGYELLKQAVKNGGIKLDSFHGNHAFYSRNGFKPISYCTFDEKYAPPGWKRGINDPEDVVFYIYTGEMKETKWEDVKDKVKRYSSYDKAMKKREIELKKYNKARTRG